VVVTEEEEAVVSAATAAATGEEVVVVASAATGHEGSPGWNSRRLSCSTADVRDDGSIHHIVARSFFSCTICIPPEEVMG
jgi:hypothetical protein